MPQKYRSSPQIFLRQPFFLSQQKQVTTASLGWGGKQLRHLNCAGRGDTEEMQFHFPVTPLTWIKVGAQENICKNSSMQTSEGQGHARFTTLWVPNSFWSLYNMSENSSRMTHASRILDSRCKGQRTTAMRYHTSLIKLPDIYQPEYRPWQWQGKKKFRCSFSENHCWWTQSLHYNYRTTLSLSKALRISPLRFFSKPSQIQWLIKQFQRTIILGCDSHDCDLWLTPNHQDNFCMNTWSCRKWGEHCWASREDWAVITFLCLCGSDHVYHELSLFSDLRNGGTDGGPFGGLWRW